MNILILEADEVGARLPRNDRRWEHLRKILRKVPGDRVAAGLADGPIGSATVQELDDEHLVLQFEAEGEAPSLLPLRIIMGFPRPIQAARAIRELASLGAAEIYLTGTELGEKSYVQSDIFRNREFRRPLIEGAEQAGNPRLSRVTAHWSLKRCLEALDAASPRVAGGSRIALHPYGGSPHLGSLTGIEAPLTLAIGSERGWTEAELSALCAAGFAAARLGDRILKTETAAVAACSIALARIGLM
ncbi:MAG: RsmE family RNA methyltransferase [Spirochaetaceae bacterium]|nr:RsmE family RNA methyltransferase [Spirochaetaceae bacterium]